MLTILGALLIGVALGLLGSGGSILTVPALVYVLHHDGKAAIAESLAIVGGIAAAGAIRYGRARQIDWRSVVFFGLPGMAGTYGGAWLAQFVPGTAQLILFAIVMFPATWMMLHKSKPTGNRDTEDDRPAHASWKIPIEGLAVGVITGLVGVGGGFLIVPALVLLGGLPMRLAVGTSLVVIAMKSFTGWLKYLEILAALEISIDWMTVGWFVAVGVVGTLVGHRMATKINQRMLQRVFAVFLVLMGGFVLSQEFPKLFAGASSAARVETAPRSLNAPELSASGAPMRFEAEERVIRLERESFTLSSPPGGRRGRS